MTDITSQEMTAVSSFSDSVHTSDAAKARLRKRYGAERRFQIYGILALAVAISGLILLLGTIISRGYTGFMQTYVALEVFVDPELVQKDKIDQGDFRAMVRKSLLTALGGVETREERTAAYRLLSNADELPVRDAVRANPEIIGQKIKVEVLASSVLDLLRKGYISRTEPEETRKVSNQQIAMYDRLVQQGTIYTKFNWAFFTGRDSAEAEQLGMLGAIVGSIFSLGICVMLAFPMGVATAIYLEEFAPKNKWTDLIEVNISNLAAVPSIVFGLLGLAVFIQFLGLPRSAPIVAGFVLALMSLPIVIIASRAALRAVPPSIRQAAIGLGASKVQVVLHHVLPLAMPGIMTGVILAMAHALGETAPLLMIGMKAFAPSIPGSPMESATVIPALIYNWFTKAEPGFYEKTYAGIMVLLGFLLIMNTTAVYLRRKLERRW